MGRAGERQAEVEAFLLPHLDEGELVVAVAGFGRTYTPRACRGLGLFMFPFARVRCQHGAIVVTDRAVWWLDLSNRGTPKSVLGATMRRRTHVIDRTTRWDLGEMVLGFEDGGIPGREFRARGAYRADAALIVRSLTSGPRGGTER